MPAPYGFSDRSIAERLKQIASNPDALTLHRGLFYTDAWFAKAPTGGIPAISGDTLGKGICDCYKLAYDEGTGDAQLVPLTDSGGATVQVTVHHAGNKAINADKYLIVAYIYSLYVPIVEFC